MSVSSVSNQKTIQQIIDDTSATKASERNTGELGKDEFINLLVTQLQYQDPLNPQDDTQFIAQMAQFSALEQMQNLNTSYSATQAFGMIGKTVTANLKDGDSSKTNTITGEVTSVKMQSGKAYVIVNGNDIPVENVQEVKDGSQLNVTNLSEYTGLIGYECGGYVYDSDSGSIVGVKGVVKEINKGAYENYAVMDGVTVNVAAVDSGSATVNSKYKEEYLKNSKGQEVSLIISDDSGKQASVKAVLNDYSVSSDGRIKAVLDGLNVSVDGITNIKPAKTESDDTSSSETRDADNSETV
ncbi:flagellar hook capping FlgD N-terminal domain-containing protein [Acetivibrio cellulolyticus]|uniref:flagellar hook capping FlgD N-terminal domain-containing protein n=1 Tax=Acetivibrio cellulolyticus TaxID=35830 RepID=UPI0001E2C248|nr:flagellar hook capping FlgD N-terminal domain-containing protein [Acetivibrio cellulolyticus]